MDFSSLGEGGFSVGLGESLTSLDVCGGGYSLCVGG